MNKDGKAACASSTGLKPLSATELHQFITAPGLNRRPQPDKQMTDVLAAYHLGFGHAASGNRSVDAVNPVPRETRHQFSNPL